MKIKNSYKSYAREVLTTSKKKFGQKKKKIVTFDL